MENQYYVTFQYYDRKGRRLAVFCRFLNPMEAEVFTLTCSKADQFTRKYARKVYEAYLAGEDLKFEFHKPVIELVIIQPEERELQVLLGFCERNYYTPALVLMPTQILLNKEERDELIANQEQINY